MSARDIAIAIGIGIALTAMFIAAVLEPIYDAPYSSYSQEAQ